MVDLLKSFFGKKEEEGAVATETAERPLSDAEPIHVTDASFDELVLGADLPVMVDFWAPWCGPCRMVAPIVEQLAQAYDGQAVIAKVNTDENPRTPSRYGIMGIPTLILFKDGQEVDRVVGFAPRKALEERLKAAMNGGH
jgi:thioredoxin 1